MRADIRILTQAGPGMSNRRLQHQRSVAEHHSQISISWSFRRRYGEHQVALGKCIEMLEGNDHFLSLFAPDDVGLVDG